jgi:hypothetical protein
MTVTRDEWQAAGVLGVLLAFFVALAWVLTCAGCSAGANKDGTPLTPEQKLVYMKGIIEMAEDAGAMAVFHVDVDRAEAYMTTGFGLGGIKGSGFVIFDPTAPGAEATPSTGEPRGPP